MMVGGDVAKNFFLPSHYSEALPTYFLFLFTAYLYYTYIPYT
jgi:hypothetical protein